MIDAISEIVATLADRRAKHIVQEAFRLGAVPGQDTLEIIEPRDPITLENNSGRSLVCISYPTVRLARRTK